MVLRARRRNVVVWSSSRGPRGRHGLTAFHQRPASTRPLRRLVRISGLLTAIGLIRVAGALRARWKPVLAGVALTATGVVLRDGAGGLAFMAGFLFLYAALVMPVSPAADRERLVTLERELADYSTPAERRDLEAILDRYSDGDTSELRDILTRQATATHDNGVPGLGRPPVTLR
jgi:hypothetical protein